MADAIQYNKPMATDYYTWAGAGDPKDFLDPPNWKDGKVPPMRGASIFVPSGSKIETVDPPPGMMLKRFHVQRDPKGTPPEKCTRIAAIHEICFNNDVDWSKIKAGDTVVIKPDPFRCALMAQQYEFMLQAARSQRPRQEAHLQSLGVVRECEPGR